jgi:hypothetical protein
MELPPSQFWSSTPRQITASFEARQAVVIQRHNDRAWLAWHAGILSKNLKRVPTLDSLKIKMPSRHRQTWEQQLAVARMWSSRNHGKMGKAN